jgi:hypothetical protein
MMTMTMTYLSFILCYHMIIQMAKNKRQLSNCSTTITAVFEAATLINCKLPFFVDHVSITS